MAEKGNAPQQEERPRSEERTKTGERSGTGSTPPPKADGAKTKAQGGEVEVSPVERSSGGAPGYPEPLLPEDEGTGEEQRDLRDEFPPIETLEDVPSSDIGLEMDTPATRAREAGSPPQGLTPKDEKDLKDAFTKEDREADARAADERLERRQEELREEQWREGAEWEKDYLERERQALPDPDRSVLPDLGKHRGEPL